MIVTYPDHTIRNIPDLIKAAKARSEPIARAACRAPERRSIC